jgi:hypothetical protein
MAKNKRQRDAALGRRGEIVFDPVARTEYLRGFSERKKKRRTFGLAMQKVKDRKAKLEQRAEERQAIQEQIEEMEKQKDAILEGLLEENKRSIVNPRFSSKDLKHSSEDETFEKVQKYQDIHTQSMWGGEVVVKTSTYFPGDSDEEDEAAEQQKKKKAKSMDVQQEYAGNVEKFMLELKGNLPGRKKGAVRHKNKGKYGAAGMKGMAKGGDLKIAQKALHRSQAKLGKGSSALSSKRKR